MVKFKVDPHSKAIIYNNKPERDRLKIDRIFKNHLHKEVQFLADCTNWTVDDYSKKFSEMQATIDELKLIIEELQAKEK